MDDARPGRHHAQPGERSLRPAEELVALAVPLVLAGHVEGERVGRPEAIDLDRMVDHEVGRDQRVDPAGVAAEGRHRVPHRGQVDDGRDAREVLEDHARGQERDLRVAAGARPPAREAPDVGVGDDAAPGVAQQVLQEDLDRDRGAVQVDLARRARRAGT